MLYPPFANNNDGTLDVGDGHQVYWEESGNPAGPAVIFLHGGPGAGCAPAHRRFFDPKHWRIVLFDQRGCGRSTPAASVESNTTQHLIADIESIREHLGIERWLVFGGSWGSTLGLVYGIAHPERCSGFVLRGIFLGQTEEVRWFMEDMGRFFPDAKRNFLAALPEQEHENLLENYHHRLVDVDPDIHRPAAKAWSNYESACARLIPPAHSDTAGSLPLARLEVHYFVNDMFLPQNYILDNITAISHLPCIIVQGRYDIICPPWSAEKLALNWPGSRLEIVGDAGHSAFEPGIVGALVKATNTMKLNA
ncbi:MAG: prolyl aminopeptidase [Rhodospirillales bacterium]|nr:prolyl aminopeptidase [Rhodospirillales bacterium]